MVHCYFGEGRGDPQRLDRYNGKLEWWRSRSGVKHGMGRNVIATARHSIAPVCIPTQGVGTRNSQRQLPIIKNGDQ